jgi:hypothetical protein
LVFIVTYAFLMFYKPRNQCLGVLHIIITFVYYVLCRGSCLSSTLVIYSLQLGIGKEGNHEKPTKNHNWNWNLKLKRKFPQNLGFNSGFGFQFLFSGSVFFPSTKATQICVELAFQFWFWCSIWFLWFSWNPNWNPKTELKQKSETETTEIRISLSSNIYIFSNWLWNDWIFWRKQQVDIAYLDTESLYILFFWTFKKISTTVKYMLNARTNLNVRVLKTLLAATERLKLSLQVTTTLYFGKWNKIKCNEMFSG